MIPYGKQQVDQDDIDAVVEVLQSTHLTQGDRVPAFELAVAQYCGATFACAVNSATSGLHVACLSLGLGPGDWLWTSPITFVASSNCGLYCGASVDFVDVDPSSGNMCEHALGDKLRAAKKSGRLPKVVVVVHLAGHPCSLKNINKLSEQYGFYIIEDAAHALGSQFEGTPIGSSHYSDLTVFSFHPVKPITSAEGGMIVTNQKALHQKNLLYRNHGVTRDESLMVASPTNDIDSKAPWIYQQVELGFNYRLSDLHAALGLSQLAKLENFVSRRNELAGRYDEAFVDLPLKGLPVREHCLSGYHIFVALFDFAQLKRSKREIFESFREAGFGVNVHYIPVHTQPYYQKMGFKPEGFPGSMEYYRRAITLPLFPALTDGEQDEIIAHIRRIVA